MSIKAFELVPAIERTKLMADKANTQVRVLSSYPGHPIFKSNSPNLKVVGLFGIWSGQVLSLSRQNEFIRSAPAVMIVTMRCLTAGPAMEF